MKNITTFDFNELKKFDKVFCLVSGGIDSTYLYEMCKTAVESSKLFPVNCFNPFENSPTLKQLSQEPNFILIKPDYHISYAEVIKEAFRMLPKANRARKVGKYNKKIFPCCRIIKHDAFKKDPLFIQENTVVLSGIKSGDGRQRFFFLKHLKEGKIKGINGSSEPGFYHKHLFGAYYCYPFRDYAERDIPQEVLTELRKKYPDLKHSGCALCPVLVLFDLKDSDRYIDSLIYSNKILGQQKLDDFSE